MFVRREYSISIVIGQFLVFFCIYIYRCCNYCCCVGIEKDIDLYMVFVLYMQNYMILEKKDILCVIIVLIIIILRIFIWVIELFVLVNNKMFMF